MVSASYFSRALLVLCFCVPAVASDPTPPCPAPFSHAAVSETWCSTPIATNAASGVTIAQYGLPLTETLVTSSTNGSIWYDSALFYLGGGIGELFEYLGGRNAANESIIATARTVPIVIRSPLTSQTGEWETSMMISTLHFPDPSALPAPLPDSNTRLEQLGARTFATLDFNSSGCAPLYSPPYFTLFQRCDAMLAAGLPVGWELKEGSSWTPSWLLYNGADFNGTWTNRCLAEVQPTPLKRETPPAAAATPAPLPAPATSPATHVSLVAPTTLFSQRALRGNADAPPICAVMLEFETVYYGAWAPPHAPNTAINIDGGSIGSSAKDDVNGIVVLPTSTDTPFFALRLVAITLATGAVTTIGNCWPYPPPGFSGTNGLFVAVEHHPSFGFIVLLTEISQLGPVPTRASEPGIPVGWTVAATVDVTTGKSTALTADLTPALAAFPSRVGGLSALDTARSMLWLIGADDAAQPYGPTSGCKAGDWGRQQQLPRRRRRGEHAATPPPLPLLPPPPHTSGDAVTIFLGIPLTATPPPVAPPPNTLPSLGGAFIVTAFEFSSAADALVTLEYDATGIIPPYWRVAPARVVMYAVNGSTPVIIGVIAGGQISPAQSVGASQVSADGRFVYFSAVQGSAQFESASLLTVDTSARTVSLVNAAPSDDYDVFNLYRC